MIVVKYLKIYIYLTKNKKNTQLNIKLESFSLFYGIVRVFGSFNSFTTPCVVARKYFVSHRFGMVAR